MIQIIGARGEIYNVEETLKKAESYGAKGIRVKKVDENETGIILNHFKGKKNILNNCIKEIKRLDKNNYTCKKDSENFECKFKNQCLRWKIS